MLMAAKRESVVFSSDQFDSFGYLLLMTGFW